MGLEARIRSYNGELRAGIRSWEWELRDGIGELKAGLGELGLEARIRKLGAAARRGS